MIDPFEVVKNLAFAIVGVGGAIALVILVFKALAALSKGAAQAFVGALIFALIIMMFTNGKESMTLLEDLGDGLRKAIGLG